MTERAKVVLGKKVDTGKNIYEERFHMLMKLIRIHRMMEKAKANKTPDNDGHIG